MRLKKWSELPVEIKNEHVKEYYDKLSHKGTYLMFKRVGDVVLSFILVIILSPLLLLLALIIKLDSPGPIFYRQERVTQYGRKFRIFKFRSMVVNADKIGTHITVKNDRRITNVGKIIRKFRLDELPQLFNILSGEMTFVGTRPEATKYVDHYTDEMKATLLLPAGVTSLASIEFRNEAKILDGASEPDEVYVNEVLPKKMSYNLEALNECSIGKDIILIFKTALAVIR